MESVSVCKEIASKHELNSDGTFEEVSRWMDKVATLHREVEKSYAKFVKQLNQLREEFRSVHRRKEVVGIPDIDVPMENLIRTLSKTNEGEEDFGKMLAMFSNCPQEKTKVKKIEMEVRKVDAEVQTECLM